jgi:hypothetical protein
MPALGESATAKIYNIQDKRSNRGRSDGVKAHEDLTWVKCSGSMVSQDQYNRAARKHDSTRTTPSVTYRSAIELQDYANRIQEHWRAAHNLLHG